jgi:HEAT repeat protein
MDKTILEILQAHLPPDEQWRRIQAVLPHDAREKTDVLSWLVEKHKGYVDVRIQAGTVLLREQAEPIWSIIERLITSDNPDDRDVALSLLSQLSSERAHQLARPLLHDTWPYLQLEAAGYLKEIYPAETAHALEPLLQHQEAWVRTAAKSTLDGISDSN